MFDDAMPFACILVDALVLKVADRMDTARIGLGDARARGIARQRMAVTRPGRERVEEVVVYGPTKQARGLASRGRGARQRKKKKKGGAHQDAQAARPAVPSVASSRALRPALCWRWSVQAGTDW